MVGEERVVEGTKGVRVHPGSPAAHPHELKRERSIGDGAHQQVPNAPDRRQKPVLDAIPALTRAHRNLFDGVTMRHEICERRRRAGLEAVLICAGRAISARISVSHGGRNRKSGRSCKVTFRIAVLLRMPFLSVLFVAPLSCVE